MDLSPRHAAAVDDRPETALDVLLRRAAADPHGEVVRFLADGAADPVMLTAGAVVDLAARAAVALRDAGVGPGDRVVTCLPGSPALLGAWFGLAARGAVEVPLGLDIEPDGAMRLVHAAGPALLVVADSAIAADLSCAAVARRFADEGGRVVVLGRDPWPDPTPDAATLVHHLAEPLAPAIAMATSGTTGRSKAAVLPHFAGVRQARRVAATMGYGSDDVLFNVFPWHHINARHSSFLAALHSGARLVAADRFSVSRFWTICREQQVSAFNFMGAMVAMLERAPAGPDDRAHRVTRAYGAPAPARTVAGFEARFGVRLLESFASTELADVTANTVERDHPGTAGAVLPEYEVAVRDAEGRGLPADSVGTVHVRPRRRGVAFLGYLGDDAATAATVADAGWIRTGDLGRLTSDGVLVHAGRRSDVIRRRGENISAPEVAEAVAELPGVEAAVVVGVASALGEQEVALTVAAHGITAAEVHAWCVRRLPRHAVPRYVRVVGEIPLNRSMKVDLVLLGDPGWLAAAAVFEPPGRPDRAHPDDRNPAR